MFYNIYPSVFSLQLPTTPLPFRRDRRPFHLKNHNVGQGSVWSLSWKELSICFFPRCSREIGGRWTRLWQRVPYLVLFRPGYDPEGVIFGAVTEDSTLGVLYTMCPKKKDSKRFSLGSSWNVQNESIDV